MPTLTDGLGFIWDFKDFELDVSDGTSDAYDGAFGLTSDMGTGAIFYASPTAATIAGRYVLAGAAVINDITVTRRAYVSDTGGWVRFEEVLTNNTASTLTRSFTIGSNLGSDSATTIVASSSGDAALTMGDSWLVTDDGATPTSGDPRLGFVFRGTNKASVVTDASLTGGDDLSVTYSVTLAPGQTAVLVHFAMQSRDAAAIEALAAAIASDANPFLVGMPADLVASVFTFDGGRLIAGTSVGETLTGGGGNDTISGLGGNDSLVGLAGNDRLDGGIGNDTMVGGQGNDNYIVDSTGDVIIEFSGAVNGDGDLVRSSVTRTLEAAVEHLELTGTAVVSGTGNALNNRLIGNVGNNTLMGLGGNDTLDGGNGEDSLVGGLGDDEFYINSSGDRVNEQTNQGTDTVYTTISYSLGFAIENAVALGAADVTLIGNTLANRIEGNDGDNLIRGGGGADTLLGGAGNDTLIAEGGDDVLIGGSGRDTFRFTGVGGTYVIEDEIGLEIISARDAGVGVTINLTPGQTTTIGGDVITFSNGTNISSNLDFVFLQDLSGSFDDDVSTVRTLVPNITSALTSIAPNVRYGYSSFVDKPTGGFGSGSDYVYRTDLAITADTAAVQATVNALRTLSGNDEPESQIEALMQVALRTGEVGYRAGSLRVVLLMTDANFHKAGDFSTVPANDGDAILDGSPPGTGEDYPSVLMVTQALQTAGILPVFAVTSGNQTTYQTLVDAMGFGAVVNLAADSANIITAIRDGLEAVATTFIEGAEGSGFADLIGGNALDNELLGLSGNDTVSGDAGNDTIVGGAGADSMIGGADFDILSYETTTTAMTVTLGAVWNITGSAERTGDVFSGFEGIRTGLGADSITGSITADWIEGFAGNDTLLGGNGNDTLLGGEGKDLFTGGGGLDKFIFTAQSETAVAFAGRDVINTFAHGDKIDLSAIDARTNVAGDQAFTFIGAAAFSGVSGQLRFDMTNISATGVKAYTVYGDVNGDSVADLSLQIYTAPTTDRTGQPQTWNLANWDFVL
jgi:Ca2+-binding RTX toxin-like protein